MLAVIPVATIYMKVGLGIAASVIMYATSCNLAGVILGNALASPIVKYFGLFKFQVLTHLNGLLVIGLLLFVHEGNPANMPLLFAAFLLNGITQAALMCLGSTRQLSLGQPDNAVMKRFIQLLPDGAVILSAQTARKYVLPPALETLADTISFLPLSFL